MKRTTLDPFVGYVIVFHLAWAAWPFFLYPKLIAVDETTLAYAWLNISIRLFVWVAPVFLYLRYVDRVDPFAFLKLKGQIGRGVMVALGLTALNLTGMTLRFGAPHPSMVRITWNSVLGTSLLIGLIEEIPYRGFMLQKFAARGGFWVGNLITSVLFLAVHVPGWIALHAMRVDTVITIFIFGFLMGIVFKYSDSLWAAAVTHSTNDFLSFVLFRL